MDRPLLRFFHKAAEKKLPAHSWNFLISYPKIVSELLELGANDHGLFWLIGAYTPCAKLVSHRFDFLSVYGNFLESVLLADRNFDDHDNAARINCFQKIVQLSFVDNKMTMAQKNGLNTLLLWAALNGFQEIVPVLLEYGADANMKNVKGLVPLHYATKKGHSEVVDLLLQYTDENSQNNKGKTPLHYAASKGHIGVARLLIEYGADVNKKDTFGWTPLRAAVNNRHEAIVRLLLENNAYANVQSEDGYSPLHVAADGNDKTIVYLLLNSGADVTLEAHDGETPLFFAARNGHVEVASILLQHGARINKRNQYDLTPLHNAALNDRESMVEFLLKNGAHIDALDINHRTPLHLAAKYGQLAAVHWLLWYKADVNNKSVDGMTPLIDAAFNGHDEVVSLLLEYGANVNDANQSGRTPLFFAARAGHVKIVRLLLEHGASLTTPELSLSELIGAVGDEHKEVLDILVNFKSNANQPVSDFITICHEAAQKGSRWHIRKLMKYDPSIRSNPDFYEQCINRPLHETGKQGDANEFENFFILQAQYLNWNLSDDALHHKMLSFAAENGYALLAEKIAYTYWVSKTKPTHFDCRTSFAHELDLAARKGDLDVVVALFKSQFDYGAHDEYKPDFPFILNWAAERGYLEVVQKLIRFVPGFDLMNPKGYSLAHWAVGKGYGELVKELVASKANLETQDPDGDTPLHIAAMRRKFDIVRCLVAAKANLESQDNRGRTPLHTAVRCQRIDTSRLLIAAGANIDSQDNNGNSPLHRAAKRDQYDTVRCLIAAKANLDSQNKCGRTPLHVAIRRGSFTTYKLLIAAGANIDTQDNDGNSPLHLAAKIDDIFLIQALPKTSTSLNLKNACNQTPLDVAASLGHEATALLLFKHMFTNEMLQPLMKHGDPFLVWAATNGHVALVQRLLKPNLASKSGQVGVKGYTLLHWAAQNDYVALARTLIKRGDDINPQDNDGRSPMYFATECGHIGVVRALLAAGAKIDLQAPWLERKPVVENLLLEQRTYVVAHAMAMAKHVRLGTRSKLAEVDEYLLRNISKLAVHSERHDKPRPENKSSCIIS